MKLCLVCNFQFEDEQELCPKDYSKLVPLGKDQLIGQLIQDRYRIDSTIAKGSMGTVYKATQELIGREVAVKVLHGYLVSDEESIKRFHKEAKAASRLNHPNITTLYDYGLLSSGQPYIVMDLLHGSSLADVLKQREYLPLNEALIIFKQVCDAVAEAHRRGVIHRDLKPENIMLDKSDRGVNVKVVDFGIATFMAGEDDTIGKITKTGTVCGSPTYMSPEQCDDNKLDHRSDIYSLGVVIYETLTGQVPFGGTDIYGVMTMHVKDPPPLLRTVRPDLQFPGYIETAIQKALAKAPNDRFQSATDFYDVLSGKDLQPRSTGNQIPVGARQPSSSEHPLISSGNVPVLSEAEVKSVVARALKKRMEMEGNVNFEPQVDESGVPHVDPGLVRKTVQQAAVDLEKRRTSPSSSLQALSRSKMRRQITPGMRIVGMVQQMFPMLLTVALFASLFFVVRQKALINSILEQQFHIAPAPEAKPKSKPEIVNVDELVAQNKLDQARVILENRKKDAPLSDADEATLNGVYVKIAKREMKAKHYKQAAQCLEALTGDIRDDDEIKAMLKRCRKAAGK